MAALAMVFSVQQGQHGPLVVYKLEIPQTAGTVAAVAPAAQPVALPKGTLGRVVMPKSRQVAPLAGRSLPVPAKPRRLSSLQPTILGTVVMPAAHRPAPLPSATAPAPISLLPAEPAAAPVELDPFAFSDHYRGAAVDNTESAMINPTTGEPLTLESVNDDLAWRRDTARKLRRLQVGPRF